jgi:hypothetical protein
VPQAGVIGRICGSAGLAEPLTGQELQVLALLVRARPHQQVANELGIGQRNHVPFCHPPAAWDQWPATT